MPVLMKDAIAAKAAMKDELTRLGIQAACGVTTGMAGLAVKVNVSTETIRAAIPSEIKGVPVIVEVTGEIRAW